MRLDAHGDQLVEMLSYKRPYLSKTEQEFCDRYLAPLGAKDDKFGNYLLRIGTAPILWSSHTDTVHRVEGRQRLKVKDQKVTLRYPEQGGCLGADCGTGVWLMREMVKAGVEGLYIWHAGEESGCLGSQYIAENTPEVLDGILQAVAFDRRGYDSIVSHQIGMRTCSDAFARSWAEVVYTGLWDEPDPTGVFTDTCEYAHVIPECTNVSVGYDMQHSSRETQDLWFALILRDALLKADFTQLVCERDPAAPALVGTSQHGWHGGWSDKVDTWSKDDYEFEEEEDPDLPPLVHCDYCGNFLEPSEALTVLQDYKVCWECYTSVLEGMVAS